MSDHLAAVELHAGRVTLEPLRLEHAEEMVDVLADEAIYRFIGGEPPTLESLRSRYRVQVPGVSPDGRQSWLNWVIRIDATGEAAGYVQSTIESVGDDGRVADVAWVVAPRFQGRGLAKAAAAAMCDYLQACGVDEFAAFVHPDHESSQAVARSLGFEPTSTTHDGEVRWTR